MNAVIKDKNIVFFHFLPNGNDDKFDIYNVETNTWYIGVLPEKININAAISVNNTVYIVAGRDNEFKSKVWKVEF